MTTTIVTVDVDLYRAVRAWQLNAADDLYRFQYIHFKGVYLERILGHNQRINLATGFFLYVLCMYLKELYSACLIPPKALENSASNRFKTASRQNIALVSV